MTAGRSFVDTNVLLYMQGSDPSKQATATGLFKQELLAGRIVLSTQVVQEFYVVGLRKLQIPPQVLRTLVSGFLELPLVAIEATHIRRALEVEEEYRISFWDALILAAAEASGATILYTEDLNHRQLYGSVRVENPFRATLP